MSVPLDEEPGRKLSQLAQHRVSELRSVRPRRVEALSEMGIESVLDLLTHYPRRYVDRTKCRPIAELKPGEEIVVSGVVESVTTRRPKGRRPIVEVSVDDGSGQLVLTFFNQPWRARQLTAGSPVVVFGRVETYRNRLQLTNPLVDLVGTQTGRIVAIYPQSVKAGVTSAELSNYVAEALERAKRLADPVPARFRRDLDLIDRTTAFSDIHRPSEPDANLSARRRLAFDELFRLQVKLVMEKRRAAAESRGIAHDVRRTNESLVGRYLSSLPFELTAAQQRVLDEIATDLGRRHPMHRLLQGDVGAGKTVVALATALFGIGGGYQAAFMVPTEVLAEQHYLAARRLLAGLSVPDPERLGGERPVRVGLLTARTAAASRRRLVRDLGSGGVDLLIGTHALITDDVGFLRLGVVVIDEQHRFGVDQRAALREKGATDAAGGLDPDLLVMTATPIPRTAAMTVYGDLDLSILDELPRGRAKTRTFAVSAGDDEAAVWSKVREEVASSHQAYVICPLVRQGQPEEEERDDDADLEMRAAPSRRRPKDEETEQLFLPRVGEARKETSRSRAAEEEAVRLSAGELSSCRVGLLHGQLPPKQKEEVMAAFRKGEIDVLVATTVVEVGVDVPSATVAVVLDADRFGIAQLHQLRGRVGRGEDPSFCFLVSADPSDEATRRIGALVSSSDGFELAEVDLDLRGEGTVLGTRQKGRTDLKLASLRHDRDLVLPARHVAEAIVGNDPTLSSEPMLADELRLFVGDEEAEYLMRS